MDLIDQIERYKDNEYYLSLKYERSYHIVVFKALINSLRGSYYITMYSKAFFDREKLMKEINARYHGRN